MVAHKPLQEFLNGAHVAKEIFDLRPDYRVLLIALDNVPTGPSDHTSENLLLEAEAIPHIAAWREAYKGFGTKPNKIRNSLEALTRRVEAGLPRVNKLTDTYNAISVKHQIPLGGEDLARYDGPPHLKRAIGSEIFETKDAGAPVSEKPEKGEVVWCDNSGVTCRRWNWRQGTRTALAQDTTSVLIIMDALQPCTDSALNAAADELVAALKGPSSDVEVARRLISSASSENI